MTAVRSKPATRSRSGCIAAMVFTSIINGNISEGRHEAFDRPRAQGGFQLGQAIDALTGHHREIDGNALAFDLRGPIAVRRVEPTARAPSWSATCAAASVACPAPPGRPCW